MSYGVSNETPWNSDAHDTKHATMLKKIWIPLDPPTRRESRNREDDLEIEKTEKEIRDGKMFG